MKKLLFILIFINSLNFANAQYFPLQPWSALNYSNPYARSKQILIMDSTIYTFRSGGMEAMNTTTHATSYHFANYFQMTAITSDTGNNYVYLKGSNYIGRYNNINHHYENILHDSLLNKQYTDIGVSPDGKIWVVTANISKELLIYDGVNWQTFHSPYYLYYGYNGIRVVNDTLAYLFTGNQFFDFHNGQFDSLYTIPSVVGYYYEDYDADQSGNVWIAARYKLIHINGNNVTIYDSLNTPLVNDEFLHVKIGTNGHVWTAGNKSKLLEFDGSTWQVRSLPSNYISIENFSLDSQNNPWSIVGGTVPRLYKYSSGSWTYIDFPFMPLSKVKTIGTLSNNYNPYGSFANDEGIFSVIFSSNYLYNFSDTSNYQYANEATSFVDNEPNTYSPTFGTNHGIQALSGFNNTLLPNDTINHICYDNGTYYIATNNGLVAYNGILYTNINTSNAPLPSNKITYVTTGDLYCSNTQALYIGTDKGVAIYQNAQWQIFDSSNVSLISFYVTGIQPPCWGDTSIYVSTFGSGLIALYPGSGYDLYNTANGKLLDDTLYH